MMFKQWLTIGMLVGTAAFAGCGDRPGRDEEVLFNSPYPDLASIPEDKPKSRGVSRQTSRLYNGFQAQPNDRAVIAADFAPTLARPVLPPRGISETRGADEFTTLSLDDDVSGRRCLGCTGGGGGESGGGDDLSACALRST